MRLVEIFESIDQREADELLRSLVSAGDPVAKYFQQTRYDTRYTTIDAAQRAAERMWHREHRNKERNHPDDIKNTDNSTKFHVNKPNDFAKPVKKQKEPADWGDRFHGNQHTGSLGHGVDLDIDFDQQGLKTIGKGINAVKTAFRPVSSIAKAFGTGMQKAPVRK